MNHELLTINNELRTTNYQLNTSDERQATSDEFALFWSFFASFCASCASLRLIKTVFSQLLKKANNHSSIISNHLTMAPSRPKTSAISAFSAVKNSCLCAFLWLKNPRNQRNPRLINDLRSTKDYVRKNKLFMQNKANFQKVKFSVTEVLTKNYDRMDTWSIRKTKPIQSQLKPIKANIMPKQSQFKPKQTQYKANFRGKIMLPRMKFNPRLKSLGYYAGEIEAPNAYDRPVETVPCYLAETGLFDYCLRDVSFSFNADGMSDTCKCRLDSFGASHTPVKKRTLREGKQ